MILLVLGDNAVGSTILNINLNIFYVFYCLKIIVSLKYNMKLLCQFFGN